jgi:hypothetical protein
MEVAYTGQEDLSGLNSTRLVGQFLALSDHAAAVVMASW